MPALAPNHREIADWLCQSPPHRLENLPSDQFGLYGLYDHLGQIRYVGETADEDGFYGRIFKRHVTGSLCRSHQYAAHYIPLWGRHAAPTFVRRHCVATFVSVPGRPPLGVCRSDSRLRVYKTILKGLEARVLSGCRARGFALDWNK